MNKKVKVTFFMLAFNGERFIEKSIASVLNQKEKDIRLVIRNNGSVDSTGDICKKYAKKDKRVIYLENKTGFVTDDGVRFREREFWPALNSEYVAYVDHDDLLDSNFTTFLYEKAKGNDSDIAICSAAFFCDETEKILGYRNGADFSITNMGEIDEYFPIIYGNFRPLWGKLYRSEFFDKYYNEAFGSAYEKNLFSGDTFEVLTYLENCKSLSSIKEPLYFCRISNNSQFFSKKLDLRRINDADILFDKALNFITSKNIDTDANKQFLILIHEGHMIDLLGVLSKTADMTVEEKITYIQQILKNKYIKYYINSRFELLWSHIFDILDSILSNFENYIALQKYYIVRLYNIIKNKSNKTQNSYISILSVILDKENPNKFGFLLLEDSFYCTSLGEIRFSKVNNEIKNSLLEGDSLELLEFLMYPYSKEDIENHEKELESFLIKEDYEKASELLFELGQKYPECKSVVNYRMQLLYMIGDIDAAKELAYIAKILYTEDKEISELCDEVILS